MPKISVWMCPKTGLLFKEIADYRRHKCDRAIVRARKRKHKIKMFRADDAIRRLQSLPSFDAVAEWLNEHHWDLARRQMARHELSPWYRDRAKFMKTFALKDVRIYDMTWNPMILSRWCAPVGKNRSGNSWVTKPEHMVCYPGWEGKIEFDIGEFYTHSSDLFRRTPLHLGSGGSRKDCSIYELTMFAEEWPLIAMNDPWDFDNSRSVITHHVLEGRVRRPPKAPVDFSIPIRRKGRSGSASRPLIAHEGV